MATSLPIHPKNSISKEVLENYKAAGVDLTPYTGQELHDFRYELKEERAGRPLTAVLFEQDGKIVASHVVLPDASPGIFPIDDREGAMQGGE
ncbi:DUF4830 domain-containing protein [Tumebacillus sp. BK434]|uniref:DUF4830 domain-containing protein n=1 Tax=Tumebacillus sp. BK434 TaxID=2512169 RepID=UPI0010443815|nr:DUF4830 domain-containing protein [Tumebacillus sp. BK434]